MRAGFVPRVHFVELSKPTPLKRIMVLVVFIEPGGFPSSSVAL
jgi:hypothetical protein